MTTPSPFHTGKMDPPSCPPRKPLMPTHKLQGCLNPLLSLLLTPVLVVYMIWAWSVTIGSTWAWFCCKAFQVEPLTAAQVVAVSACLSVLATRVTDHRPPKLPTGQTDWPAIWSTTGSLMVSPWVTWLSLWFVHKVLA